MNQRLGISVLSAEGGTNTCSCQVWWQTGRWPGTLQLWPPRPWRCSATNTVTFGDAARDLCEGPVAKSLAWYRVASSGVTVKEYRWEVRVVFPTTFGAPVYGNCCAYRRSTSPFAPPVTVPLTVADRSPVCQSTYTSPVTGRSRDFAAMVIDGAARAVARAGSCGAAIPPAAKAAAVIRSAV